MGIYDRDHRQNDPWKKKNDSFEFNESKGEVEFDQAKESPKLTTEEIKTYYDNITNIRNKNNEEIKKFHEDSLARKKQHTSIKGKEKNDSYWLYLWIIGILIIIIISVAIQRNNKHDDALPIPFTSILTTSNNTTDVNSNLTIIANNKNYYITICDTLRGDKIISSLFIRPNEEITVELPEGNYRIKYGTGKYWYGTKDLFGKLGEYGNSQSFEIIPYQHMTISFNSTKKGNLHINNINKSDL